MKSLIAIFSTLVILFSRDNITCSDLRTGTFTDRTKTAIVKRTSRKQTESYRTSGLDLEYEFDIIWTNNCEYILILTKTNQAKGVAVGDTCKVKINEIFDDRYTFDMTYKKLTKKEVLFMIR